MSDQNNPYAGNGGGAYSQNLTFGDAAPQAKAEAVKDVTTASFKDDVLMESRKRPVLVDFWAPWCGPCKQLAPVLEKVVADTKGAVRLVKMNIDEHPSIAGQLGIQSIPAVIAFVNGQPADGFMGAVPESQIKAFIARLGAAPADPLAEAIEAAKEAMEAGDRQAAEDIYSQVLAHKPDHEAALIALATLFLDRDEVEGARELVATLPDTVKDTPELTAVRARLALADEVAGLGDASELESRLAKNPKDHDARFDLAMIHNARGDRERAADELLHIVRTDRAWRDDGARAQLLKFFEAWGMTDDATLSARRRLSSLLFS